MSRPTAKRLTDVGIGAGLVTLLALRFPDLVFDHIADSLAGGFFR